MFINPKHAIQEGWVKFPEWMSEEFKQKCIQPNALDFTADRLFTINSSPRFMISETYKSMRPNEEVMPGVYYESTWPNGENGGEVEYWELHDKCCYDAMSDFYVTVPEGVAAHLITRSTFNRNGVFIQSGLYDSGFKGNCGFVIYNMGGPTSLAPHTRIGQLIFTTSEDSGKLYAGGYSRTNGVHWTDPS